MDEDSDIMFSSENDFDTETMSNIGTILADQSFL